MSTPINNGGPAFPFCTDFSRVHEGMTLRDYFAGQALQGILMNYTTKKFGATEKTVTRYAYRYADAMLAERERKEAQP